MIVYFEDDSIVDKPDPLDRGFMIPMIRIDAGRGFTYCRKMLWWITKNLPFNTPVYTNSLDAFSNTWCWDNEKGIPMIYIRNGDGEWTLINELTDKYLRRAVNLEKLYIHGYFRGDFIGKYHDHDNNIKCLDIDNCNCERNLEKTYNYMDGYGTIYICANCKRYYIKLDTQIIEVEFIENKWRFVEKIDRE